MSISRRVRRHGLRVEIAELGAWGSSELLAEYDGREGVIRVSALRMRSLRNRERRRFFLTAVAHELYHHLERIGEVEPQRTRAAREEAARAFARGALS